METLVIWIDPNNRGGAAAHHETHPHEVHIYSEVDEVDHAFRVQAQTTLGHVFDEFYSRTGVQHSGLDRMKCEKTGEDLLPHRELTIKHLTDSGLCDDLTWVFSNRPIRIFVDTQPKEVDQKEICFAGVVNLAYDGNPPQGDNWVFTVGFSHGPKENREGSLTKGKCVKIKDGMRFDVSATNES